MRAFVFVLVFVAGGLVGAILMQTDWSPCEPAGRMADHVRYADETTRSGDLSSGPGSAQVGERQVPRNVRKIASWQGTSSKTTEPFTITGSPCVVKWASSRGGFLGVQVCEPGDDFGSLVVNTTEGGADNSFFYRTGTFYLKIYADNCRWRIEVWGR